MRLPTFALTACFAAGALALTGCQQESTYETQKPVIEETPGELDETPGEEVEEAGDEMGEAVDDAADAVTPDESIVDVDSPIADVNVGRDPATGRTNVDVDDKRGEE